MRVLLLGATGYVGGAVLDELVRRGHEVVAVVRPGSSNAGGLAGRQGVRVVAGDAAGPALLARHVRADGVDAVVHAAAVGDWDVDHRLMGVLAAALADRRPQAPLVYTSGVWVLGADRGVAATEASAVSPIALVAGRERVEQAVITHDEVRGVVVRPGIVHGREGGILELMVGWSREDRAGRYVAGPDGPGTWPMVHADDLAALVVTALEDPEARGVLHAVAEPRVPVTELAAAAAAAAEVAEDPRPWALTDAAAELGAPFAEALALSQHVDAPAARALGWRPTRAGAVAELRGRPSREARRSA